MPTRQACGLGNARVQGAPFWYVADAMLWATVVAQTLIVIIDIARCFTGAGPEPPHELIAFDEPV